MTHRFLRGLFAGGGTVILLAALAAASGPSWSHHNDGMSRLRLSWGARPERIEVCRRLSEAELADRPEHMRQRVECEGSTASYQLQVRVDGRVIDARVIRGGGLRHDRPMYLLDDLRVAPGSRRVVVTLVRREAEADTDDSSESEEELHVEADTGIFSGRAEREREERKRRKRAAIPAMLRLDTVVTFQPGRVRLLTFDAERQVLQLRGEGGGR